MRHVILLICLASISSISQAQIPGLVPGAVGRDVSRIDTSLLKKMVNDVCPCLRDLPSGSQLLQSPQNIFEQSEMNECMAKGILKHRQALQLPDSLTAQNFTFTSLERVLDPRIILFAFRDCPYMFNMVLQIMDLEEQRRREMREEQARLMQSDTAQIDTTDEIQTEVMTEEAKSDDSYKEIEGKITKINTKAYTIVSIVDDSGKTHDFVWFNRFYNSEHLLANRKKMLGKRVRVSGYKQEIFEGKRNQYEDYFMLNNLEFL